MIRRLLIAYRNRYATCPAGSLEDRFWRRLKLARFWWRSNGLLVALWLAVVLAVGWGWM